MVLLAAAQLIFLTLFLPLVSHKPTDTSQMKLLFWPLALLRAVSNLVPLFPFKSYLSIRAHAFFRKSYVSPTGYIIFSDFPWHLFLPCCSYLCIYFSLNCESLEYSMSFLYISSVFSPAPIKDGLFLNGLMGDFFGSSEATIPFNSYFQGLSFPGSQLQNVKSSRRLKIAQSALRGST